MKCPNCGEVHEDITSIGMEEYDCKVYTSYEAHCHYCECDWHWEDVYEYTETTTPYQIKQNDHP